MGPRSVTRRSVGPRLPWDPRDVQGPGRPNHAPTGPDPNPLSRILRYSAVPGLPVSVFGSVQIPSTRTGRHLRRDFLTGGGAEDPRALRRTILPLSRPGPGVVGRTTGGRTDTPLPSSGPDLRLQARGKTGVRTGGVAQRGTSTDLTTLHERQQSKERRRARVSNPRATSDVPGPAEAGASPEDGRRSVGGRKEGRDGGGVLHGGTGKGGQRVGVVIFLCVSP